MIQRPPHMHAADDSGPKWLNSPVTSYDGSLSDIRAHIPTFERRRFELNQKANEPSAINAHLDAVVRLPLGEDKTVVPIGVVSKDYALVPHTAVLDMVTKALDAVNIPLSDVRAALKITKYGERMSLSVYLPAKYHFDPGDGYPMTLSLECLNSVDGSTRFRVLMGWFRFVCSNGLIIGVSRFDIRRRHVGDLHIEDIGAVLASGLNESETDKRNFEQWRKTPITVKRLVLWTEDALWKAWGFKAATRAFHIARTGTDVKLTGRYQGNSPTTIAVRKMTPVPGAPTESRNLYDVSQVLAWLAKERRDVQKQFEWRAQISGLMERLIN